MANKKIRKNEFMKATDLYEEAGRRYEEVGMLLLKIKDRLDKYPPGKIHIVKNRGEFQYYLRTDPKDRSGKYITKKDKEQIRCFVQKKYDEKIYRELLKEHQMLERVLTNSNKCNVAIQALYSVYPEEIREYIEPVDITDEEYVKRWVDEAYEGKKISEEGPIYMTDKDERVRSKSEINIANMLTKYGIPYKYECPFMLSNGRIIYPDFTVLNVKKRKKVYWEHRGMMDDMVYSKHTVQRMKSLAKEGVVLGDNLIITEETQSDPLGTNEIENIIKKFF